MSSSCRPACSAHRFRRGRAHLLDAEGRGRSRVSILDGGYRGLAGGEAIRSRAAPASRRRKSSPPRSTRRCSPSRATVERESGGATLVDARPAAFFAGKEKAPAAKAYGHIPGARQCRQRDVLRSGDQPAAPQGRARRDRRDAARRARSVAYCNTGHWAATDWFVLSEMLGRRMCGSTTARWSNGPPMRTARLPVGAHATGTI